MQIENTNTNIKSFNTNDKQFYFNQIKGKLYQVIEGDKWCVLVLEVGHEKPRYVSFSIQRAKFDLITDLMVIGLKLIIQYFLTSHCYNERWFLTANVLQIDMGEPLDTQNHLAST